MFAHAKHEIGHLSQWRQNISNNIVKCSLFPTMGATKKGGSFLDLKVNHKCNEPIQKVKDGGDPTWCGM
jgi:hypothetical protein